MAKRVARPVNARPFAIPKAIDTIEFRGRSQRSILCAPDRCRAEVFVQRRLKQHIHRLQLFFGAVEHVIDAAKG